MLEGLVAWVLNTYLGKYVNNLNTDQLSVALLKGAVELENLPLKKDALKELELPFEVKAGFIGKIRIQIPFYRPHLDPWVISISRLHLVGSPDKQEDFDELKEKLFENARKKVLLKVLEEKWKSEQEQKGESYWYSVTASIVTRIVDNIELKIQDVHLRFEDGITYPSHPFAFGVCIKNVSVQNASREPVEKFLRKKQLEVEDFSIYWDVNSTLLGDLPPGELQDAMDKSMEGREHQYILEPVCSSALLKRNCSKEPLRSRHQPRIECDICLKTIPLTLSQAQYQQIVEFVDDFDRKERQMKYRKWRPKVPVLKNCREWWLFALNANLSEIQKQRQRLRLEFLLHRAQDAVFYCEKHYNRLQGIQLSAEHEAELDRIEEEQSFEELSILRQQVHDRLKKQHELAESLREPMSDFSSGSPVPSPGNQGSGMLQYLQSWFPGWGGWYGNPQEASEDIERLTQEQQQEQKSWNPEDILVTEEFFDPTSDAANLNTFTKRDHVFVKLNFHLEGGTITLLHKEKNGSQAKEAAFMQLEFSGMAVRAESLPRRHSSLLLVQLGGLFLRDLATQGTIFPELVYPNAQKEVAWSQQSSVFMASADVLSPSNSTTGEDPVFKMLYERNPVHSVLERRLEVSTRPLNIIYNPQAITKVADFFYQGKVHSSGFGYQSELELRVAEAARRQYNKLKMQTKAEIRQTIDRLLVGEFIENSRRWTLRLDICAPHVIFPDDFLSKDPVLVVVDLGRILLTNSQDHHNRKVLDQFSAETNELSDDEYKTPLATPTNSPPPEMDVKAGMDTSSSSGTQLSEEQLEAYLLSNKMYEKYSLSFKDLQIMVGHVKDNWKHIQDNEVGPTHVVEKFNVHLQLERRLIYTSDPQYPGAVLSGTLPDLKIHINEDKIFALRKCITSLSSSESRTADNMLLRKEKIFIDTENYERMQDSVRNLTQSIVTLEQHTREVLVESKLLLAEFKINYMQLGVESCGRYISLLKVFGSNAHFVKRPYDAEVSLTVHGLLMVDTMQTYGSDFDLLMASHKNLCLDAPTGSLRESRAQSPVSETNDFSPSHSYMNQNQYNSLENVSLKDQESLIKIEYQFVSSECPSMNLDSSLQVMTVQVNNLDIILNPETMVELIAFLQKSFPRENIDDSPQPLKVDFETDYSKQESYQSTYEQNTQVAIDINRLNILLFRTVTLPDANSSGRKIATASIGGTKVNVSLGSRFSVNGSLGCLQLMDLAQESSKTQYVISIGNTAAYENQGSDADCFEGFFVRRDENYVPMEALSFTFIEQSKEEFALNLKMASLHYNHSAKFLKELTLSMDELEDNFRNMLKTAASKVSSVLATKTAEYSEMVSLFETPRKHRDSMQYETDEYDGFCPINVKTDTVKLILNINIESPVVSIPRSPGSPELLVGHLGQIFIQNFVSDEEQSRSDRLHVEIKDIKLYSLNSSDLAGRKEFQCSEPASSHPMSSSASVSSQEEPHFTRSDFFESLQKNQAFHILHNTTIQFKMEKFNIERDCELTFSCMEDSVEAGSILKIEGNFVNYVQVVLAKHVYEQVLQTLDNLIYNEDLNKPPQSSASPSSPVTPEKLLSKSADVFNDQRERHLFDTHSFKSMSSKSVSTHEKTPFTQIQANFRISELQIQLSGDLTLGAQGLVSLKFQDFDIEFNKDHPHTLAIQIALRSLLMEDLLEKNPDSKYKNLMVSRGAPKASSLGHKEYLSQSCPLVSHVEYPDMPRSLPSHMEEAPNVFQLYQRPTCTSRKKPSEENDDEYPLTPPPSPTAERSKTPYTKDGFDESLVHINVFLVDRKHPEFSSKYKRINRSVNVDFNCLDVLVTLQTWVVILDFFGIGSTADNHAFKPEPMDMRQSVRSEASTTSSASVQEHTNTKMDLKVHSLSLVLKKTSSELAKASVSKLTAHLENVEGDLALQGSIGSLSLSDLTVHGELYAERFTTSGDEALIFHIFKYGSPDPKLKREYDVRVSLRMASVQYVHTQRFQSEVVSFIQHFTQLQDVLGRQRAANQGQTVRDQAQRASRILLDIEAGAPVLLIPESSRSKNLIVANLGKLKVKNRFLFSGASGTFCLKDKTLGKSSSPIVTPEHKLYSKRSDLRASVDNEPVEGLVMASSSKPKKETKTSSAPECPDDPEEHICLLDCIVIDLQDMDIFAAERHPRGIADGLEKLRSDLLFPSYVVKQIGGSLLLERCRLKLQLERNLDKEISHSVPDMSIHGSLSSVHCSLDLSKYRLIRGLLDNNLGEPVEDFMRPYDLQDPRIHTVLSGEVYTSVSFLIDMVNVSLELLEDKAEDGVSHSLARFDFKKSKLLFESFSNQTKSINLVSHSMMAFDTRYTGHKPPTSQKPKVFNCILQPSKSNSNPGSLQIELHHRSTKDTSCFTVVLNNLRVFLIFDWLLLVQKFLQTPSETKKVYLNPDPEEERSSLAAVVPKTVKSGVVTKRSSVQVTPEKQLEVKINVTGTEFVVVEDASCVDTSAIILKGTTVLTYRPKLVDRPFSGSLFGIEVFSCCLGNEHDTALSIIDPVHVQIELVGNSAYQNSSGLMDAFNTEDFPPILEIQLQTLDIRLSYNDVQLFLAIAKSIPGQTSSSAPESAPSDVSGSSQGNTKESEALVVKDVHRHVMDPLLENQLARLQELGFAVADCRKALLACQGQLNKAATWLFKNAEPLKPNKNSSGTGAVRWISGVELKADNICICFIDDCMDCDVPLAEITFSRLNFFQHLVSNPDGSAEFMLSGDYYNRELSGWEPFIEPWPSAISWQHQEASRLHPSRLKVDLKAKQRLDINITSVLIDQYVNTKESWMADYCKLEKEATVETENEEWRGSSVDPPCIGPSLPLSYLRTRSTASLTNLEHQVYARVEMKTPKRRQPFIPFALRNHTGCTLWFATLTTTPTRAALSHSGSPEVVSDGDRDFLDDAHNVSQWIEVPPGDEIPFEFETREKLRHRHTHDLRIHQLQVRVSGWEQVSPVSVDKVGIFFRYAAPDKNSSSSSVGSPISRTNIIHPQVYFSALPPVRVLFAVTMEGSARKVVTVRSSLIVKNKLEIPMELRLDSPSAPDKPVILPAVMPGDSFAVPLHLTSWRLQARPRGMGVFFCKTPIHWTNVTKTGEVSSSKRECHSMDTENSRYFRFCVALRKENYPDYMPSNIFSDSAKQIYRQPGHTIFLLPTVVICNLLPCELNFYVKGSLLKGTLKSGKEMALHTADTSQNFELGIAVENFQHCKELLIPPGTQNYMVRMRLYDSNKRQLNLTIRITCRAEGSLKIFISAPYWLINKTGLPLIFRQDNAKTDAAGQFEEHELARSLSPLLFCYADKELPNLCTMRVGKGIHPDGIPGWCQAFSLDGGSGVRALKVIQQGNRPGLIYNIGIDVKKGRGRYIDTCMVTFAPRYLLINKSSHKLAFAQREFARGQGTNNPDGYISTLPGSSVVFHWPRNDYDQLLCVRFMDVSNCTWSGGFEVNKNNSFHINMRDTLGKCYFLRVEITLQGATYRVSFSNTDQMPPPFRVDNFSKVPVMFMQHGVAEPRLRTEVKGLNSLEYAWDEPILPSYITLTVKGAGSSETVCNMNDFQDSKQLYYENFIYIAATYTFSGLQEGNVLPVTQSKNVIYAELVLDVQPKTLRVILKKKEPGKRSQLWRMTGTGMLCHEGSSPPHNPNKPSATRSLESSLVLDIAGLAAVTDNRYEPLMLRKPDRRRSTTQTWCFRDGKLSCSLPGLVVQARNGVSGLYDGAEVVLGPDASIDHMGSVPKEQQFINQKMRPGSGVLSVRVIPDGPTRVLQITDFQQRRAERLSSEFDDLGQLEIKKFKCPELEQELEVTVKLQDGIGISLINKLPEELVFASFTGINVHYMHQASSQVLELHIQNVQVDNQLIGTTQPAMLFVTPKSIETEEMESGPAIQVNAMNVPSKNALTDLYKHLLITAQKFTVQIEEKLLLKLLSYFGFGKLEAEVEKWDENIHEKAGEETATPKRYYFENLKIALPQIKLSVFTSNKLPPDLKALKSTLGFPLIKFEDAVIDLDPYTRVHPYESREFIVNDVLKHFQEELLSQAAKILGSVDFLGNPMGLLNDVSEGVSGLIKYGNVGGLIRNVTHGVSNSAAKFAGTLSDGLGKTMDNRHQTEREYIRYHAATSGEHLVAGIHGLAHGIIGGLTSVITSTVEGVKNEGGISGFISGLGKGLVGTVTKPVAGALDFASETAQAVRDTATLSGHRMQVQRVRRPRCCTSPQGLLPRYSETQAEGQEQLFRLTDSIQDEFFIAVEHIDSYCVLISSKAVYFLKWGEYVDRDAIFLEIKYDDLYHCLVSKDHGKIYVQLTKKAETTSSGIAIPGPSHQKPMVHIKSEALAVKISQEINYAKSLYYEQQLMLRQTEEQENLDLNY
ncbi:LOW QUALITY PROTEIN: vacuolar protein sorting-associated protein 13D [Bufo gargarizans]|uniref:LOW QUALITY PROTEIN: vacuolar protein sorting-associated protein 13D n=1 Tax=Bufo gargarizans TaxID=30331 RepID=UPI001CF4D1B2|nr:LOW QUALITY PROTEIN: vacuolar protein sorting-associated protein 13D [Bufo gargarizans]